MKRYYAVINEEQQGPFTIEELGEKEISVSTLIWTEELEDWTEARNIDELKTIFKKTPPPVPKKSEKIYKVEAEIRKNREKLLKPETEVVTAKEIKTNFKLIFYALLIGLISYPIIFATDEGFSHINMHNKWEKLYRGNFNWDTATEEVKDKRRKDWEELERESRRLGWRESNSYNRSNLAINYHERRYKFSAEEAIWPSIVTAIIAALALIIGRYVLKGAKWVEDTSKRKI